MNVVKTNALTSYEVTAQLICALVSHMQKQVFSSLCSNGYSQTMTLSYCTGDHLVFV